MQVEYDSYDDLMANFSWDEAWTYADGTPENVNATHECLDRHPREKTALSVATLFGFALVPKLRTLGGR